MFIVVDLGTFGQPHGFIAEGKVGHLFAHVGRNGSQKQQNQEHKAQLVDFTGYAGKRGQQRPVRRSFNQPVPAQNESRCQEDDGYQADGYSFSQDKPDIPPDVVTHQHEGQKADHRRRPCRKYGGQAMADRIAQGFSYRNLFCSFFGKIIQKDDGVVHGDGKLQYGSYTQGYRGNAAGRSDCCPY